MYIGRKGHQSNRHPPHQGKKGVSGYVILRAHAPGELALAGDAGLDFICADLAWKMGRNEGLRAESSKCRIVYIDQF